MNLGRKCEKSLRSEHGFFLQEIVFEGIRLPQIVEGVIFLFCMFQMQSHMLLDPIGFPVHKGMDDILGNGKWGPNDELLSFGYLDGDRATGGSNDFE